MKRFKDTLSIKLSSLIDLQKSYYQHINLSSNYEIIGKDRSSSASKIFDKVGIYNSLLDVGCNFGFFCFYGKKWGYNDVVGVDKDNRCIDVANIINESFGTKIKFIASDFFQFPFKIFDVVLALNISHHIPVPYFKYFFIELGKLTKYKLVLELATPVELPNHTHKKLDLIKHKRGFFIKGRLLKELLVCKWKLFKNIEIEESPRKYGRILMYCHK